MAFVKKGINRKQWTKHSSGRDLVYYKPEKGSKGQILHTTYTETVINSNILNVICVLSDVSQYKDWLSVVSQSSVLHEVSSMRKLSYLEASLPAPMQNR